MKIVAFIDGFNLYHALDDNFGTGTKPYGKYKWLNYWELAECFTRPEDRLVGVYYFTAFCPWSTSKRRRHKKLVKVQKDRGVLVVRGYFRKRDRKCKATGGCHKGYIDFEEKRTDVNIATMMLTLAFQGKYDKALLITADSDLRPAIEAIRALFPHITIINVVPIKRSGKALRNVVHHQLEMKVKHLKASRLPGTVALNGGTKVSCPQKWQ